MSSMSGTANGYADSEPQRGSFSVNEANIGISAQWHGQTTF